jgi:hypothetical protein
MRADREARELGQSDHLRPAGQPNRDLETWSFPNFDL